MLTALIIKNLQIDSLYKYTKNFIFIYDYFLILIGFVFAKFILDIKENKKKKVIIFSVLREYYFQFYFYLFY